MSLKRCNREWGIEERRMCSVMCIEGRGTRHISRDEKISVSRRVLCSVRNVGSGSTPVAMHRCRRRWWMMKGQAPRETCAVDFAMIELTLMNLISIA